MLLSTSGIPIVSSSPVFKKLSQVELILAQGCNGLPFVRCSKRSVASQPHPLTIPPPSPTSDHPSPIPSPGLGGPDMDSDCDHEGWREDGQGEHSAELGQHGADRYGGGAAGSVHRSVSLGVLWNRAMQELEMIDKRYLATQFDTRWIKDLSQVGSVRKMPFFVCKIDRMDYATLDPKVYLEDCYGTVEGGVHREVIDQFGLEFRPGSVIVLQNVSVIISIRGQYLNITLNNLVSIYSKNITTNL